MSNEPPLRGNKTIAKVERMMLQELMRLLSKIIEYNVLPSDLEGLARSLRWKVADFIRNQK